ncbi:hypothetical protein [Paraburkholderia sp. Ac-20347]|jgi:hypothetical protein|uniref:hypothetical protein n=1 Tax=Paraburkholderia sp. Ac-20347 TaxID=2703892 RepID=UPI00197D17CD|nr:hypothetical protein [Paraburkholderia sp. Ac-20347]MBN3808344.1 hypothetical protein [Paraburkholderia sp. Ac-20347]
MLHLLSLHALAAERGDGLRPELLALLSRQQESETGLSAFIEPVETQSTQPADERPNERLDR